MPWLDQSGEVLSILVDGEVIAVSSRLTWDRLPTPGISK